MTSAAIIPHVLRALCRRRQDRCDFGTSSAGLGTGGTVLPSDTSQRHGGQVIAGQFERHSPRKWRGISGSEGVKQFVNSDKRWYCRRRTDKGCRRHPDRRRWRNGSRVGRQALVTLRRKAEASQPRATETCPERNRRIRKTVFRCVYPTLSWVFPMVITSPRSNAVGW